MLVLHGEVGLKLILKKYKQNNNNFFATTHGKDPESAFPLMNLLDILSGTSIFKLQTLKFAHCWQLVKLYQIFLITIYKC